MNIVSFARPSVTGGWARILPDFLTSTKLLDVALYRAMSTFGDHDSVRSFLFSSLPSTLILSFLFLVVIIVC